MYRSFYRPWKQFSGLVEEYMGTISSQSSQYRSGIWSIWCIFHQCIVLFKFNSLKSQMLSVYKFRFSHVKSVLVSNMRSSWYGGGGEWCLYISISITNTSPRISTISKTLSWFSCFSAIAWTKMLVFVFSHTLENLSKPDVFFVFAKIAVNIPNFLYSNKFKF